MWDVAGKAILISGATSGVGLEAAVTLARRGARVSLIGRNSGRLDAAVATVRSRAGAGANAYLADFSSQVSIRQLAPALLGEHPQIDVLVNNAGGIHRRRSLTVDGIETTFATNHLGHFLLTNLLAERLIASAPARVITVASVGHRHGTMNFDDLGFERGYTLLRAYERSKLANVLFANELARRLAGTGVTSNSVHPGSVATKIWSDAPVWSKPLIALVLRWSFISPEVGGQTIVQLAASAELERVTGQYFEQQRPVAPSAAAQDSALAQRLWDVSATLVGGANPVLRAR